jgi:hypothetical protein
MPPRHDERGGRISSQLPVAVARLERGAPRRLRCTRLVHAQRFAMPSTPLLNRARPQPTKAMNYPHPQPVLGRPTCCLSPLNQRHQFHLPSRRPQTVSQRQSPDMHRLKTKLSRLRWPISFGRPILVRHPHSSRSGDHSDDESTTKSRRTRSFCFGRNRFSTSSWSSCLRGANPSVVGSRMRAGMPNKPLEPTRLNRPVHRATSCAGGSTPQR